MKKHERKIMGLMDIVLAKNGLHIVEAAIDRRNLRDYYVETRKAKGMTQQQFADRLGLSLRHVVEWETCDWPDIRLSLLRRYSMVLDIRNTYGIQDTTPLPEPEES